MKLKCSACLEYKSVDFFSRKSSSKRGYSFICKSCHNKYARTIWYVKNRDRQKAASKKYKDNNKARVLSKKHKVPIEEVEQALKENTGTCPICSMDKKLVLDHCHKTQKVRGMICQSCNNIIGRAGDTLEGLMRFVRYLS